MPGFSYYMPDGTTKWRTCARIYGGFEMTFSQADKLITQIIPRLKSEIISEGADTKTFYYEFARDGSGDGYIALTGMTL